MKRVLISVLLLAALVLAVAGCGSKAGGAGEDRTWAPYSAEPVALFPVTVGSEMGYIDQTGSLVIPAQFAGAADFSEGLAAVQVEAGGPWGFIDKTGAVIIDPQFYAVLPFSEGRAPVQLEEDGKWGYIDITGTMVIPTRFALAWGFSEDLARARTDSEAGYIDAKGGWALRMEDYLAVDEFSDGVAPVYGYDTNLYGFIDKRGKVVLEPAYEEAWGFTEGVAGVKTPGDKDTAGLYGYIEKDGDWFIEPQFADARPFSQGMAAVQRDANGKWGYVDKGGSLVIGLQWDGAGDFKEGLALVAVMIGEDYYTGPIFAYAYIDADGDVVWRDQALAGTALGTEAPAATTTTVTPATTVAPAPTVAP